ncbi:MAG: hypothetical protein JJU02_09145 [Cryomorphaceae bacterium]|nr:hypothetical protein [Cryomorphaceae bacterium]
MKKLIFFFVISVFINACSIDGVSLKDIDTSSEHDANPLFSLQPGEAEPNWGLSCNGCDGQCDFVKTSQTIRVCSGCENCSVEIERFGIVLNQEEAIIFLDSILLNYTEYFDIVDNHFDDIYETSPKIVSINYYESENNNISYFHYNFYVEEELKTIMISFNEDESSITKVDCDGGCNDAHAKCREIVDLGANTITCSCEGSCAMYITTIDADYIGF